MEEATNDRLQKNKARPCSASQEVGNSCRVRNIRCIETGGSRHRERLMRYGGDDDEDGYDEDNDGDSDSHVRHKDILVGPCLYELH